MEIHDGVLSEDSPNDQEVERPEKSTVPLPELKENGTVSDPNVPSKAIENSYQEIVPQDQKDIAELKEHSNGFETNEIQISLAVTEADSVGLEANKQRKKMEDFQDQAAECNGNSYEEIMNLRLQLQQSHLALSGSEKLVAELRESLSGAEQRAEQLVLDLTEAQKKLENEVTERDKKYAELDAKLGKLQKRAKQRIQELQKEKEDVESQLAAASEKASQALSQCASLQHDLERVRAQAGEALRTLDTERQQLRIANNKQKEIIEDLQQNLDTKEREHKEAQQVASEKEQVVNELTGKIMEVEEKHGAAFADLVSKHQKVIEDLKSQLADAILERTKSTETITALQIQLAQKEAHIAELEATSSGETIRLTASLEAARGELVRIEQEHRKERETWDATLEAVKLKLDESEKLYVQLQMKTAIEKSQMESEIQGIRQTLSVSEAERDASREQAVRLEKDFNAYKVRAYSLLQKKEAELSAAKDAEWLAAQEASLKEAQNMAAIAITERDRAVKRLRDLMTEHEIQLAARSGALLDAEQKIRELATKLESTKTRLALEQESCQSRIDEINAEWQDRYNTLQEKSAILDKLEQENISLKESYTHVKDEHYAFQQMANKMLESKDKEITRLLEQISHMQIVIDASKVSGSFASNRERDSDDKAHISIETGEQQILILARQQAQREEELMQCQRHIQALQDEIVELEHENRLHTQQKEAYRIRRRKRALEEAALKEELRNLERCMKREGVDMTYLKNVIMKLLETGEVEALLPVIAMLLQFSPDELRKCQEVYALVPGTPSTTGQDVPRTLLSRFLFSKAGK